MSRVTRRVDYFNVPVGIEEASNRETKAYVVVIYDIPDNRRRLQLARLLLGFGERVQESSFEAMITKGQLARLMAGVERLVQPKDHVRIYKIRGSGAVFMFGEGHLPTGEDVVFV